MDNLLLFSNIAARWARMDFIVRFYLGMWWKLQIWVDVGFFFSDAFRFCLPELSFSFHIRLKYNK